MALKTIIVTRHQAALAWIQKHHPELTGACLTCSHATSKDDVCQNCGWKERMAVLSHATPEDVAGNRVIGILPEELSSLAAEYWKLSLVVPAKYRGKELTVEDMERFGCSLKRIWVYLEDPLQGKIVVDPTRDGFNCPFYTPEGYSGVCVCTDKSQNPRW